MNRTNKGGEMQVLPVELGNIPAVSSKGNRKILGTLISSRSTNSAIRLSGFFTVSRDFVYVDKTVV